jgi:uncharacterized transporter YbjL
MTKQKNIHIQISYLATKKGAILGSLFGALIGIVAGTSATQAFSESPLLIMGATLIFSALLAIFGAVLGLFVDLDRRETENVVH